jgi:hypothetical protein
LISDFSASPTARELPVPCPHQLRDVDWRSVMTVNRRWFVTFIRELSRRSCIGSGGCREVRR